MNKIKPLCNFESIESKIESIINTENWKLLIKKDNSKELYDLSNDISEEENIYKLYPELVKELSNEIDNWKNNLK